MSCKWPEGKGASFAREKQSACSHSARATLFFQVFRPQTALSHVHQQILSAQPLKPCPETAYLFLTSWGKPLPSLTVSSYNHLRPPPPPFPPQCILNLATTGILFHINRPCHCCPAPSTALKRPLCADFSSSLANGCPSTCAPVLWPVTRTSASGPLHLLCPMPGTLSPGVPWFSHFF